MSGGPRGGGGEGGRWTWRRAATGVGGEGGEGREDGGGEREMLATKNGVMEGRRQCWQLEMARWWGGGGGCSISNCCNWE